jgi:hypothetical protein
VYEVYMFCVVLVDLCAFVGYSITCERMMHRACNVKYVRIIFHTYILKTGHQYVDVCNTEARRHASQRV